MRSRPKGASPGSLLSRGGRFFRGPRSAPQPGPTRACDSASTALPLRVRPPPPRIPRNRREVSASARPQHAPARHRPQHQAPPTRETPSSHETLSPPHRASPHQPRPCARTTLRRAPPPSRALPTRPRPGIKTEPIRPRPCAEPRPVVPAPAPDRAHQPAPTRRRR